MLRDACGCLPSTSALGRADTCEHTRSGRRNLFLLSLCDRRHKRAPRDYKSPLFGAVDTYGDVQRRVQSEKRHGIEQEGHNSWGSLICSAEGGISHNRHGQRVFCTCDVLPPGCSAKRKTSVRYKFSFAKGYFPSLKEKQIPRVLSDTNGSTAKKSICFFLLLFSTKSFDPRQGGGKKNPFP